MSNNPFDNFIDDRDDGPDQQTLDIGDSAERTAERQERDSALDAGSAEFLDDRADSFVGIEDDDPPQETELGEFTPGGLDPNQPGLGEFADASSSSSSSSGGEESIISTQDYSFGETDGAGSVPDPGETRRFRGITGDVSVTRNEERYVQISGSREERMGVETFAERVDRGLFKPIEDVFGTFSLDDDGGRR